MFFKLLLEFLDGLAIEIVLDNTSKCRPDNGGYEGADIKAV
jgi:hypothetical protein